MKPAEVHWSKKLYQSAENYAKNLALISVVVAPVYSAFSGKKVDFSFLDGFSNQMSSFSTLADTAKLFTDIDNPVITNFAALATALGGLSKGVYIVAEAASTHVVPFLLAADYSALFASGITFVMAIPPVYLLIAGTAIGVCAISYWMDRDETEVTMPDISPSPIPTPITSPMPLSTPSKLDAEEAIKAANSLPSHLQDRLEVIEATASGGFILKFSPKILNQATEITQVQHELSKVTVENPTIEL